MWKRFRLAGALGLSFGLGVLLSLVFWPHHEDDVTTKVVTAIVAAMTLFCALAWYKRYSGARERFNQRQVYLDRVIDNMFNLREHLQMTADEIARERVFRSGTGGAEEKLKPLIDNVDRITHHMTSYRPIMDRDEIPQVVELMITIREHAKEELVTPFANPPESSEGHAVREKIKRALWSVWCVSLLKNQLMAVAIELAGQGRRR
jgi:hypothetical protein